MLKFLRLLHKSVVTFFSYQKSFHNIVVIFLVFPLSIQRFTEIPHDFMETFHDFTETLLYIVESLHKVVEIFHHLVEAFC
ncbi:MAG: hypothetical protein Q3983_07745 [Capnocytophaga sp.]|nr:hypothetical protein [Capnocytophaga sp.]